MGSDLGRGVGQAGLRAAVELGKEEGVVEAGSATRAAAAAWWSTEGGAQRASRGGGCWAVVGVGSTEAAVAGGIDDFGGEGGWERSSSSAVGAEEREVQFAVEEVAARGLRRDRRWPREHGGAWSLRRRGRQ
ncbi:uncharacterized protein A4U43_UnF6630 [Asparagus officinalis]|uniref:Uncharacterized protein n=1 Tax=Asparagus officinalis TaxID=4686 RepID=A0A1R3L6F6_ASPOF|nr:uncharacterized protein A4U43_UnF6630 [Asparagus officinalis]